MKFKKKLEAVTRRNSNISKQVNLTFSLNLAWISVVLVRGCGNSHLSGGTNLIENHLVKNQRNTLMDCSIRILLCYLWGSSVQIACQLINLCEIPTFSPEVHFWRPETAQSVICSHYPVFPPENENGTIRFDNKVQAVRKLPLSHCQGLCKSCQWHSHQKLQFRNLSHVMLTLPEFM